MPAEVTDEAASDKPPLPEEADGSGAAEAEEAGPPLPDEPPADEEAGPSSSVQAWPEEENAMSPEEEERLLKVWSCFA
jgi:hypothetical protein